jgi:FtsP/CotA-like multicopper oxidase with cupredoxin domain
MTPRQDLVSDAPARKVSLNEEESETVFVSEDEGGVYFDKESNMVFGPTAAKVGTVAVDPATGGYVGVPLMWTDMSGESTMVKVFTNKNLQPVMVPVTEMPNINDTEEWEIFNFTMDAHPIHLHLVEFQVVNREILNPDVPGEAQPAHLSGIVRNPEAGEAGWKDTVIAYPGEVTRIKARFDVAGLYVWHCHIIDHEDNEMMRPYAVVPDINQDACVDFKDLLLILKDIRGPRTYDLNGDGNVNLADAVRLTMFYTRPFGLPCK